jgi:phage shock protein PspC (stress-responsive transcriptional regulator)
MNKVITINLGGNAYQLEEGGYEALRLYLETAAARLKDNPDRDEIILDIERSIAEKFRALLASRKNVVETKEVNAVISEMGLIETDPDSSATGGQASGTGGPKTAGSDQPGVGSRPRRLYRIYEGAMISGVCNGLGAYLNLDPTFIRLAFVLLAIFWGTGFLAYIVMAIVIPEAVSPEEKAAASGSPFTAQEFIRRARQGYYEAAKGFHAAKSHRQWKQWERWFKIHLRAKSHPWRYPWQSHYPDPAPPHPVTGIALSVLSLLHGVVTIVWGCAFVSLLATGMIFGLALPAGLPVWAAAVLMIVIYGLITGPMKAARRAWYWHGSGTAWSVAVLLDALIWIVILAVLACLALHYFPDLRQAIQTIPSLVHQAVSDIKSWCHSK